MLSRRLRRAEKCDIEDDFFDMIPTLKEEYEQMQQYHQEELKHLEEYYAKEIEKAKTKEKLEELKAAAEVTSPVRVVDIPTMLVEVDSEFLEEDVTWEEVKGILRKSGPDGSRNGA